MQDPRPVFSVWKRVSRLQPERMPGPATTFQSGSASGWVSSQQALAYPGLSRGRGSVIEGVLQRGSPRAVALKPRLLLQTDAPECLASIWPWAG